MGVSICIEALIKADKYESNKELFHSETFKQSMGTGLPGNYQRLPSKRK